MIVCFVFLQHVTNYINTLVILFFDVMITRVNNVTAKILELQLLLGWET